MGQKKDDCKYPNCLECDKENCNMENKNIAALLKRRRYQISPEAFRKKQQEYRSKVSASLPQCNECEFCIQVEKEKQDGYRRLCVAEMRLIEQKVSNCPHWCKKRKGALKDLVEA